MRLSYEFSNLCGTVYRQGNLVFTNSWCAQRLRVAAGRVEEIEWQKGEELLTWTRVG